MSIMATQRQIEELMQRTYASMDSGKSAYPGMSYEDGIRAACEFILGGMDVSLDDVLEEPEDQEF